MSAADSRPAELLARRTSEVKGAWRRRFSASPLRIGVGDAEELFALGEPVALLFVEATGVGAPAPVALVPGSPDLREVEKAVAFAGAAGASAGASGYDLAALLFSLRDTLAENAADAARAELGDYSEWLAVVALDAYAHAARDGALERAQCELERGMPVVLLPGGVPAAFLVGRPQALTLEAVLARLSLLAARVGASGVVLDGSGLEEPDAPAVREALDHLFRHNELRERAAFFACGVGDAAADAWRDLAARAGARLEVADRTDAAVEAAMALIGCRVVPTRAS